MHIICAQDEYPLLLSEVLQKNSYLYCTSSFGICRTFCDCGSLPSFSELLQFNLSVGKRGSGPGGMWDEVRCQGMVILLPVVARCPHGNL